MERSLPGTPAVVPARTAARAVHGGPATFREPAFKTRTADDGMLEVRST